MSGQAGGRGYLIQAVIAVLDTLDDRDWTECVLEPFLGADKIDLLLRSPSGDRVSQVKSSINAIGAGDVRSWAEELESAYPGAKQFELRLIGPVTSGAAALTRVGKVDVPPPQALNTKALLEQCAHRLDRYLRDLGHGSTRPTARELLAEALATRLGQLAAFGRAQSRQDLQKLLSDWVSELLSPAASDNFQVPHQLPSPPDDFVGRTAELAELKQTAERNDVRVIVIRGLTGVGKSVLAARAASEIESKYHDGQVCVDLRGTDLNQRSETRALTVVIQALKPNYTSSHDEARCLADFRTILNGRRVLILAENVDTPEQVIMLIPPTTDSLLIVTTQSRFDLPGAVPFDLDVLSEEDGKKLVQIIAPRVTDLASLLAEVCGNLPLAIRIACGTLNARPDLSPDQYIERLTGISERARLVRVALDLSLTHVTSDVRRLLTATVVFAQDFDVSGLSAVLDQADDLTDEHLGSAIGRHLIEWDDRRKRYRLHDLVRAYLVDIADIEDVSRLRTRHAYYYSDMCSQIEEIYREGGESTFAALNLFDSENTNIAAGFLFCADHASSNESAAEVCTAFVRGLMHVMDLRLPLVVRAQILISGLEAAKKLGNTGLVVLHTGNLGRVYKELGELDMAIECHEWVLKMATKEGHREDQALAHHHIGLAHLQNGNFLRGVDHLEQALTLARDPELAMRSLEAHSIGNLGTAYVETRQLAKALDCFRSALDLARELNDPRFLVATMTNLGVTLVTSEKDPPLAVEMLEGALSISMDLGDRRSVFAARSHLPDAYAQAGRHDEAMEVAELQLSEAAMIGNTKFEIDALQTIGDLHLARGNVAAAETSFGTMMQLAQHRNDQSARRKALVSMADLALSKGDQGTAIKLLEESLGLSTVQGREKALTAWRLGNLLVSVGIRDRAVELMQQAIEYFTGINHESLSTMLDRLRHIEDFTE